MSALRSKDKSAILQLNFNIWIITDMAVYTYKSV